MNGFYVVVAIAFVIAVASSSFGWTMFVGGVFLTGLLIQYYVNKLQTSKPVPIRQFELDGSADSNKQAAKPDATAATAETAATTTTEPKAAADCTPVREDRQSLRQKFEDKQTPALESMMTLRSLKLREPLRSRQEFAKGFMDETASKYTVPVVY